MPFYAGDSLATFALEKIGPTDNLSDISSIPNRVAEVDSVSINFSINPLDITSAAEPYLKYQMGKRSATISLTYRVQTDTTGIADTIEEFLIANAGETLPAADPDDRIGIYFQRNEPGDTSDYVRFKAACVPSSVVVNQPRQGIVTETVTLMTVGPFNFQKVQ